MKSCTASYTCNICGCTWSVVCGCTCSGLYTCSGLRSSSEANRPKTGLPAAMHEGLLSVRAAAEVPQPRLHRCVPALPRGWALHVGPSPAVASAPSPTLREVCAEIALACRPHIFIVHRGPLAGGLSSHRAATLGEIFKQRHTSPPHPRHNACPYSCHALMRAA